MEPGAMRRAMSNRTAFIIVATITVCLLLGSMVLQNIYFKADQASSSLFISPTTFSRKPNSTVDLQVKANIEGKAVVAGSQFTIEFDSNQFKFNQITPTLPWQTLQVKTNSDSIIWSVLPQADQGVTVQISGEVTFGTISFTTLKEGQSMIKINQQGSVISAIDASKSPSLYNAITSIQDSSGVISQNGETPPVQYQVLAESTDVSSLFATQKILRNEPVVSDSAAKLLVSLKYVGGVSVRFGASTDLPLTIETTEIHQHHLVNFSALNPDTRYYYQVIAHSPDRKTSLKSQTRSFITASAGGKTIDRKTTSVIVFPEIAKQTSTIVVAPRDSVSKSSSEPISFKVTDGQAKIDEIISLNGIVTARINSETAIAQKVEVVVSSNDQTLSTASVEFKPTISEAKEPTVALSQPLKLNQTNAMLMFLVAAGMILFGFFFIRLAKDK